jgi:hypothetical protein
MWPHVYVICACLVFLSIGDLLVNKHSGGPPEDGCEKRPKHLGVLYLQTLFNMLLVLYVEVSVFLSVNSA